MRARLKRLLGSLKGFPAAPATTLQQAHRILNSIYQPHVLLACGSPPFSGALSRAVAQVNLVLSCPAMELRVWALKTLDGTARGCVRRSRNIPLKQLVGLESRLRRNGVLSRDESVAAILAAIAGVPNPDPTKFAAVTAEFQA